MSRTATEIDVLERLFAVIEERKGGDADSSYTAQLLAGGRAGIAQKLGEEAVEAVIAAVAGDRDATICESADLLYHLLVLWADSGIAPAEVWQELARREGTSGIEEKNSRGK
ncbi:MAG: phosphoribosyl-ATP diphosphatase [Alphaproteobacteria bacterium]